MKTFILSLTAALVLASLSTAPAFATSGRQAVGMCIDAKGCQWDRFDDGSISIVTDNGTVINCKSADAQCTTGFRKTGPTVPTGDVSDHSNKHMRGSSGGSTVTGPSTPSINSLKTALPSHMSAK